MEAILSKLLVADNATIQQGTAELKEAFKNVETTPSLCRLLVSCENPQIRQYSAVLLRKRYGKIKYWMKLPEHIRVEFKAGILQGLVNESNKSVKNAIAQLIGVIIKHELPNNGWPELLQFIQQLVTNEDLSNKELGTYTLSVITEIAPDAYLPHAGSLATLLEQTMNSLQDFGNPTAFYIVKTMQNLVPLIEGNQVMVNTYHQMIPQVMRVIQSLTGVDDEKAIVCFELFDELCENAVSVIAPHVKPLVDMCLAIAGNTSLDDALRIKAVEFIGWLARTKKKSLIKHKLVEPILDMLFGLMCLKPDDEDSAIYFEVFASEANEETTPITCATQTLDLLALNLPPEKLIPYLLRHIDAGLQGTNIYAKKASYLAMAVLAEGCSEYIRSKYLESFVRCSCEGITDSTPLVRNAALFALGQFSEHLQPNISQYSSELLPILFKYLGLVCTHIKQEKKEPPEVDRMFYALEMFCENLNESLLPYLPTLMEKLFDILSTDTSPHVRELALSAIGSAAHASKEHMLPYFEKIVSVLDGFLTQNETDETMCLQIQAADTLGVIARTIGNSHFAPLAGRYLNLGMKLLKETEDPDLRKSVYGLFASISAVVKKEMAIVLPEIVEYMIASIQSSEGIVPHYKEDESSAFPVYEDSENENTEEDIENTDNEEDNDDDVAGYSVENAYIEEKEEAVLALKEIAEYTEEAFLPYLEKSFEETFKLLNYPQEDIRKAAIDALLQFCINFSKINSNEGRQALLKALSIFIPKLSELIRLDNERSVVISSLDAYTELLKAVKTDVLVGEGHKDAMVNCVMDIMSGKTECQDQEDVEGVETEAEQDELLIECAGDVLSNLGKVISPEDFTLYFQAVLPMLLDRLKKNKSEGQRSFAVGTISECFSGLKHMVTPFVNQLLPIFLKHTCDPSAEVRNNVMFGIGELALHGKEAIYSHYPEILQALSVSIAKESHAGVRDNVVGALARLIMTNYSILPLDQIFPVFVNQLPLKEDFDENKAVFKSILTLYQAGHDVLQPHISALLKVAVSVLHEQKTSDDEAKGLTQEFLKCAQRDFPNDWNAVCTELPEGVATNILFS